METFSLKCANKFTLMEKKMSENLCPCGSSLAYESCCKPYHDGTPVPTAEAMVRSRFSAFSMHIYDYIVETTHPLYRDEVEDSNIADNMEGIIWHQLNIKECGTEPASEGEGTFDTVTFSAVYEVAGNVYSLSEKSYFQEQDGKLYYLEGISHRPEGYRRPEPKVGRNDPCPCGSGKKFKKCCA